MILTPAAFRLGLVLLVFAAAGGRAQTVWNGSGASTAWTSAGNWLPSGVPGAATQVQFGAVTNTNNTIGISGTATQTVASIEMTAARASPVAVGTSGATGGSLTLALNGSTLNGTSNVIVRNASAQTFTLQPNNGQSTPNTLSVALGNATDNVLLIDGSGGIVIGVALTGATRHLTVQGGGAGAVTLSGNNTFGGGATLNAATLNLNHGAALGSGTFTINGGNLNTTSGSPVTISTNNAQVWNGDFSFLGGNALSLGTGGVTLSGNRQVTTSGAALTVGGAINGAFSLTKAGAGTLALSGTNSFSGGLSVVSGTVAANHTQALGIGATTIGPGGTLAVANAVTIGNAISVGGLLTGSGSAALSGTISGGGTLGGTLTLATGGTLAPGNSPGNLTIASGGTLTFAPGSQYEWELGSLVTSGAGLNFDLLTLSGNAALVTNSVFLVPLFGTNDAPNEGNAFWNSAQTWTVVSGSGLSSITGEFLVDNAAWAANGAFTTSAFNQDLVLNWSPSAIPEPSTYSAITGALTLAGALWRRQRRRSGARPAT